MNDPSLNGLTALSELTQVAEHFSRASHYRQHNVLQRLTAAELIQRAGEVKVAPAGRLLDLGAGPGTAFNSDPVSEVLTLDIAFGMCARLKQEFPDYHALCGDACALPLRTDSIDSLYSNLALQWCEPLPQAVSEMARVLRPGGHALLAMVCDGSLPQLEQLGFAVNHFATASAMAAAFDPTQWQVQHCEAVTHSLHFANLQSLLYSIKGVGANAQYRADGGARLRGRGDWQAKQAEAEALRTDVGLPLSYRILYLIARRREEQV
ncbi:methyltransferase domain-containing protein [Shewanella cyperi]|nr:methyltransferase domain-containing protein [Shewanella cyperi]